MSRRHSSLLLIAAVALTTAAAPPPPSDDAAFAAAVQHGRHLDDAAAAKLETSVPLHPDDAAVRGQLLGYYQDRAAAYPQRRLAHVLWLIRHRPGDPLTPTLDAVSPTADADAYAKVAAAWDEQTAAHAGDAAVTANAATFFDNGTDTYKAQDLLRRAMDGHPKSAEWPARLARSLERQADRDPATAADLCGQALQLRQAAYKLAPTRPERFHALLGEPADAFRTGDLIVSKRLARQLLDTAADFPTDPAHAQAVHHADTVLGLVALHSGNADAAAADLAAAGAVDASAGLAADGPDLTLARDLLAHGDRSAVHDYLVACQRLWPGGRERLKAWLTQLDAGGSPELK